MYSDGSSNSTDLKTKLIIFPIFKISSVLPTSPTQETCPVHSLPTATVFAQITNAMNMVSASKLKGAQKSTESFRPYMQRIEEIVCNLVSNGEEIEHPLLKEQEGDKVCYILVTSDRGLAGPFNSNLCKLLTSIIDNKKDIVATLGTKGYLYCRNKIIES